MSDMQFLLSYLGPNATAVFTTGVGGYSVGSYCCDNGPGLNLGLHVHDDCNIVHKNRQKLSDFFGVNFAFMNQIHSNIVATFSSSCSDIPTADAIVVTRDSSENIKSADSAMKPFVPTVLVADCTPVLLSDKSGSVSVAVHVGRLGMQTGVLPNAIEKMFDLGVHSRDIYAAIGPSICGNCYEVSEQVYIDCTSKEPSSAWSTPQKTSAINVRKAVRDQLCRYNISHVSDLDICTFENSEFYSYRRNNVCGRQAGFVINKSAFELLNYK